MKQHQPSDRLVSISAAEINVAQDITWGENVAIEAKRVVIGRGVAIGSNVRIRGEEVVVADRAQIGDDVSISSARFSLGYRSRVETRCQVGGMGAPSAEEVVLGDVSLLAADCRVFIPALKVGDYVKIHNHTLINGRKACVIGHNCWIGQNDILNAEDTLIIGNHVGLGIYTSVWTHAYYGDLLQGCNTFTVAPTVIGDDVWLVGAYHVVAPGVHIGDRAMVLSHSFVNKDVPPNHCVTGVPASDITDKLVPYRTILLDEKFRMLRGFVEEFLRLRYPGLFTATCRGFRVVPDAHVFEVVFVDVADDEQMEDIDRLIIAKENRAVQEHKRTTIFDVSRREYTKRLTDPEVELMSFLISYRAKFTPVGCPRVEL